MLIRSLSYQKKNEILRSPNKISQAKSCNASPTTFVMTKDLPSKLLKGAYGVVPFNVQYSRSNASNISFTSTPLYDINLKKKVGPNTYANIRAKFSELNPESKKDMSTVIHLEGIWTKSTEINLMQLITLDFIGDNPRRSYYITEIADESKELSERITCIMETTNPQKALNKDCFEVHLMHSFSSMANDKSSPIKGSGELSLYGAVKLAQDNGFKKVKLFSTNDSFYEKMGFKKNGVCENSHGLENVGGYYELTADMFDSFLKKIADKYELK